MTKVEKDYIIAVVTLVLYAHTPHLVDDFEMLIEDFRENPNE